ncbi:venom dipeptidyl peptidase 4-like [Choristoneura fumiferana]|uniref:venom dipeptidyl peptidase 4-like n=1 Tax=Choristoneura fumiferana TaxID=7141 RepID=UPI003D153A57
MAQESSNSTMEMGTSDQVLVATAKKKKLTYIIGFVAMVAVIAVVVTLVVVLSGNEGGESSPIVSTDAPTTVVTTQAPIIPTVDPTTPAPTVPTTEPPGPGPEPGPIPIDLEDVISGVFAAPSFNGTWTSGSEIIFRNDNGDLVIYDLDSDSTTILISNTSQILQQSSRFTELSPDRTQVTLAHNVVPVYRYSFLARYTAFDVITGETRDIFPATVRSTEGFLQNFVWGPSGTSLAFVYLNNIYYQTNLTEDAVQITTNGELNVIYNGIPDWVYEEEVFGTNNAMWFSADGDHLAYVTFDDTNVRVMRVPHYGVPGSVEYQYTQHHEIRYPKPGTTNPTVTVTLRNLETGINNVYSAPTDLNEPILKAVKFISSNAVALMWTNRVQTILRVVTCTLGQATCTQVYQYTETDGWIDNIPLIFNQQGNAFITILPQAVDGILYKQVVQVSAPATGNVWTLQSRSNTAHTVAEILKWTDENVIWYKATAVEDSSEQHIYTVDASGAVSCFTCDIEREDGGQCLYNDAIINDEASRITVNCAGPDVPQVFIYDTNGTLEHTWDDNSGTVGLLTDRQLPVTLRLNVSVAEGYPDADVQLLLPHDYEQRTNLPMLVYVYGGPDTALVTKQWSIDWGSSLVSRWNIAVAHIDGRGSGLRGVTNMFALNRRLGSVEIEDQIAVTRHLHENLSFLDSNRTCIWGWSYGGYAASLALARGGDVFRCAAAVAPVVDWRFYDTIYTERYMDTPQQNPTAYADSSLLTNDVVEAYRNKRYFLVHGTADDNVHYQHAMLISRLLQRQDVYFTQMSYTDEDHGLVGVRPHLYHALEKFLEENML